MSLKDALLGLLFPPVCLLCEEREEKDGLWYISKMQFVNNLNSNYLVVAWIPALAAFISLLVFGFSCLLSGF